MNSDHIQFAQRGIMYGLIAMLCVNAIAAQRVSELRVDEKSFRDLNHNGRLDPYEDRRSSIVVRVDDLLEQLTLEEKVGLMFGPILGMRPDGSLVGDQSY